MLAAEGARGSTCFFLTRQEAPQDGYPERYGPGARARRWSGRAAAGIEVGLHASYRARERPGAIAEEARAARRRQGLRHHYLRSDPARLAAELREAGLRYDSSIGWPSLPGLRAGTPYPYRLWDAERREAGRLGAAARPDGRDAGRGALPRPRRRGRVRGRGRRARAGRRARRRGRDPLASALAPPAALERLRPPLPAAARLDRRARRPSRQARPRRSTAGKRAAPKLSAVSPARASVESAAQIPSSSQSCFSYWAVMNT